MLNIDGCLKMKSNFDNLYFLQKIIIRKKEILKILKKNSIGTIYQMLLDGIVHSIGNTFLKKELYKQLKTKEIQTTQLQFQFFLREAFHFIKN